MDRDLPERKKGPEKKYDAARIEEVDRELMKSRVREMEKVAENEAFLLNSVEYDDDYDDQYDDMMLRC